MSSSTGGRTKTAQAKHAARVAEHAERERLKAMVTTHPAHSGDALLAFSNLTAVSRVHNCVPKTEEA